MARYLHDDDAATAMAYTTRCVVIGLDTSIALKAARLSIDTKLTMADAIIYATALHVGADLLTCDAHFKNLDRVVYFPNSKN
jgi:predicted nucleic acid-binding protein